MYYFLIEVDLQGTIVLHYATPCTSFFFIKYYKSSFTVGILIYIIYIF